MSFWNPYDADIPWGPFEGPCSNYISPGLAFCMQKNGGNPLGPCSDYAGSGLTSCMQDTQMSRISQAVRASSQERVSCAIRKCGKYSGLWDQFRCVVNACDGIIAKPGPISAWDKALCAILGGTAELPTQPGVQTSAVHPAVLVGGGLLAAWLLLGKKKRR